MTKVMVQNVKTKAIKEINKEILSDYIGTKEWKVYEKSKFELNHEKNILKKDIEKDIEKVEK